jgi:hypothetical protein
MKICRSLLPLLLSFCYVLNGQIVSIKGSGPGYKNVELKIFTQTDPITRRFKPLTTVRCDENGKFSCEPDCQGKPVIYIKAGIYDFRLLVKAGENYELLLPDYNPKTLSEEQDPFFIESELIPEVVNNVNDINNLIRIFDSGYNPVFNFVAESVFRNYKKDEIQKNISKLDKFSESKSPWYDEYVKSRMIMLGLVASGSKQTQTDALQYINSRFSLTNQGLTDLADQMFTGYFKTISAGSLKSLFDRSIAIASFTDMESVILADNKITNRELADYVILLNLNTGYYEHDLPGENVRKIMTLAKSQSESEHIRNIASELLLRINSTLPGHAPPDFSLLSNSGKMLSMKDFRGKYLLLGFVRSDDMASIPELGIIKMWQNKYSNDLQVVTVLANKNFKSASEILEKRGFNWTILDGSDSDDLNFTYDLKMYPTFLLLDREGRIISDPCPYPSENLEQVIKNIIRADTKGSGSENR